MSEHVFNEPRIALNRIYTKVGDRGKRAWSAAKAVPRRTPGLTATALWTN